MTTNQTDPAGSPQEESEIETADQIPAGFFSEVTVKLGKVTAALLAESRYKGIVKSDTDLEIALGMGVTVVSHYHPNNEIPAFDLDIVSILAGIRQDIMY